MRGKNILVNKERPVVVVTSVYFRDDMVILVLSDEREIALPIKRIKRLGWLANASEKQRADWAIEPKGYAVYWNELDDGIEVAHALSAYKMDALDTLKQKLAAGESKNGRRSRTIKRTPIRVNRNAPRAHALSSNA